MSYLYDAWDHLMCDIRCGHCDWWLSAGSGSQALTAGLLIHACEEQR